MAANKTSRNAFPCDLTGLRFGRLTVLRRTDRKSKDRNIYWSCACDCGKEVEILGRSLYRGATVSCGCFGKERRREACTTHGLSDTRTYRIWGAMIARCIKPSSAAYRHYGGRGIKVCYRWMESFEAFVEDMGECPEGMTIERVDNDGPYSKENCKWASRQEQSSNTRRTHRITLGGETRPLREWAKILGIVDSALSWRIERWGIERALTTYGPRTKATSGSRSSSFSSSSP
jgi:hypothetical protein